MAGLGLLGDGWDDPRSAAIMALAGGLLQRNPGMGLLAANQAFMQHRQMQAEEEDRKLNRGLLQQKLDAGKREADMLQRMDAAARDAYVSPDQARLLSTGPMPDGSNMQRAPGFDVQSYLGQMWGIDPMKAVSLQQALQKDETPLVLAPGATALDRKTMKPVFTAPKTEELPSALKEYNFAVSQGYQGTFDKWDKERKAAGATNVSVNTGKQFLGALGEGLGKSIGSAGENARAALGTISTVDRINEALDSGKVMAGPGTSFRQFGLQLGQLTGTAGKNAQETLTNTRQVIQGLAQLELDAAQQMKGQGQITEAERAIIRRAASGDVDSLTLPEVRVLTGLLDRSARSKIRGYNQQVQPLMNNPDAAAIAPFLSVQEPPARKPVGSDGVRRFNPATGRIE